MAVTAVHRVKNLEKNPPNMHNRTFCRMPFCFPYLRRDFVLHPSNLDCSHIRTLDDLELGIDHRVAERTLMCSSRLKSRNLNMRSEKQLFNSANHQVPNQQQELGQERRRITPQALDVSLLCDA